MNQRFLNRLSRRSVLGAGMFLGTSWALKACNATVGQGSGDAGGEEGAVGGDLIVASFPGTTDAVMREKLAPVVADKAGIDMSAQPLLAFE